MPRKRTLPSLSRVQRYWWHIIDGEPRLSTNELFQGAVFHIMGIEQHGERGAAPVCFACHMTTGSKGDGYLWLHRGHVIAETYGGTNDLANIVPLCARCNCAMPRFTERAESIEWMAQRETWASYLSRIDATTPPGVSPLQVVQDAAKGRDWTPEAFARHYGRTA